MARIYYGMSNGYIGRLGNTVGYEWRGKMCVRSMPSQYRDAKTTRQLEVRSMFRFVVAFAARARQVLKVGLNEQSLRQNMTESNYFWRLNKECFSLTDNGIVVDYASLQFSEGPVAPVAFEAPTLLDDTTISIGFEKNPLGRVARSEDLVYLVAYCPELDAFELSLPVCRRSKQLTMSLNRAWSGLEVHLWGFVRDGNGRTSLCQYIGSGVLSLDAAENEDDENISTVQLGADNNRVADTDGNMGITESDEQTGTVIRASTQARAPA